MSTILLAIFLVSVAIAPVRGALQSQSAEYTKQAEFDQQGNIYVSSDEGKLIWMGNTSRCEQASVAPDNQTVMCVVMQDEKLGNTSPNLRIEIYSKGGRKQIVEPGPPLQEWHFWNGGEQIEIHFGSRKGEGTYALYDTGTGREIDKLAEPADHTLLPQWAKDQAQISDESVPMSAELTIERRKWIAKVMREIGTIEPGMRRKDLLKVFTTEGGLSNRLQRTYVDSDCMYIKVDVHFKAVNNESDNLTESPDDIIESISRPYLYWAIMD